MASETYRLVIGAKFDGLHTDYLVLDTVSKKSVTAESKIATHPLQSGQTLSDHMYSMPDSVTFSGTFGIAGNNAKKALSESRHKVLDILDEDGNVIDKRDDQGSFIRNYKIEGISSTNQDRLSNVQETFEYIKDNGILCDLMTIIEGEDQKIRFKRRSNMALERITWNEKLNSMDYDFTFKEIISLDVQEFEYETTDIGTTISIPQTSSVSELLYGGDKKKLFSYVLQILVEEGFISTDDLKILTVKDSSDFDIWPEIGGLLIGYALFAVGGTISALSIASGAGAAILAGTATSAAIVPVGTIIAAIIGVALIGISIYSIAKKQVENNKKKENAKKGFKLFINASSYINSDGSLSDKAKNAEKNIADWNRLSLLLQSIEEEVNKAADNMTVYNIANDLEDNDEREIVIPIDNQYYYISMEKNEETGWIFDVTVNDGERLEETGNGAVISKFVSLYDLSNCNRYTNSLFIDGTQNYEIYLINQSLNPDNVDGTTKTQEEIDNTKQYLYGTQIVVSKGNINTTMKAIEQAIVDAIYNYNNE